LTHYPYGSNSGTSTGTILRALPSGADLVSQYCHFRLRSHAGRDVHVTESCCYICRHGLPRNCTKHRMKSTFPLYMEYTVRTKCQTGGYLFVQSAPASFGLRAQFAAFLDRFLDVLPIYAVSTRMDCNHSLSNFSFCWLLQVSSVNTSTMLQLFRDRSSFASPA